MDCPERQTLSDRVTAALARLSAEDRIAARRRIRPLRERVGLTRAGLATSITGPTADARLRETAIWLVGLAGDEELFRTLEVLVRETDDPMLLWEATKALCRQERGGELFLELFETEERPEHRVAAAWALGALEYRPAVRPLIRVLAARDEPAKLRGQVAEALGSLRDGMAYYTLMDTAIDPEPEVRFWSVFALGNLGDSRARPLLRRIARNDDTVVEGWWSVGQEAQAALEELDAPPGRSGG